MAILATLLTEASHWPLFWLVLTLLAFQAGEAIFRQSRHFPLCNPVLLSATGLGALLLAGQIPYPTYAAQTQPLVLLLGPATVALAIPLYRQIQILRRSAVALVAGLISGSVTGIVSALLLSRWFGADHVLQMSLAPKSATSPIAMGVAEKIGGIPSLTAAIVILTGIVGAVLGPVVMRLARIDHPVAQGVAMGTAAHGIGTARMMQSDAAAGAIAGLCMGLNGLATALLVPLLVSH